MFGRCGEAFSQTNRLGVFCHAETFGRGTIESELVAVPSYRVLRAMIWKGQCLWTIRWSAPATSDIIC